MATHGHSNCKENTEYSIWTNMKTRCYNTENEAYKDYGGRGIKICDRWLNDYMSFYKDMGTRPSLDYTLDRYPDKNGNYEPSNCRWATKKEQSNNRRNNIMINFNNETKNLKQWCEELGLSYKNTHKRIKKFEWPIEQAFLKKHFRGNQTFKSREFK